MNWFDILKEQRQVARNVQSFKPIQLDKPIKLNKPEKNCEEEFVERAKVAARAIGFNSFDPSRITQQYNEDFSYSKGKVLTVEFRYVNTSGKLRYRDPEVTEYIDADTEVTDDLFCWMMNNYDELDMGDSWTANPNSKMGSFGSSHQKYTKVANSPENSMVRHLMGIYKIPTHQRIATLSIDFHFFNADKGWQIGEKEMNFLIKNRFPNWRGNL